MKRTLKTIDFIVRNPDWQSMLKQRPYCITASFDKVNNRNLVLLKYNQIANPDFSLDIVKECRGLIVDLDTLEPVSVPFFKFGNYGESWVDVDSFDWSTAKTYEKIDGSLIKISFDANGKYIISTNSNIDAFKAPLGSLGCPYNSYGDLVVDIIHEQFGSTVDELYNRKMFMANTTYMFELTSPWNVVVIPHDECKLWLLGARNNITLDEISLESIQESFGTAFNYPKKYNITNLTEAIETARNMPWTDEGYVVVDNNYNRLKVKSPEYLYAHHLRGEGVLGKERAVKIVLANEIEEICTYFPQYLKILLSIQQQINDLKSDLNRVYSELTNLNTSKLSRKELYEMLTAKQYNKLLKDFSFSLYDGKIKSPDEYFNKLSIGTLVKLLNF
jgi:hypothetical protein